VTGFLLSLARVGAVALVASAAGWVATRALYSRGAAFRAERLGWSFAIGCALVAAMVPLSFLAGLAPGWLPFLVLAAGTATGAIVLRVKAPLTLPALPAGGRGWSAWQVFLSCLILPGVALYALRALTEPMWANDFLAIWGFKAKTIHAAGGVPQRLFEDPSLGFSHPEYPIGLPFLYAGMSFLMGAWDDHALALLFPLFQLAALVALVGWLRRRGVSREVALFAAAIVANFEPLYSGFLTGMAEVPLALGLLLFGTALADALDREHEGALRRLALASALIAATKNEGIFFAAAGCAFALLFGGQRRWKAALAALPTALLIRGLELAWRGHLPLRDFDLSAFSGRGLAEALSAALRVPGAAGWVGLVLTAAIVALGRRRLDSALLLGLAGVGWAAYLLLPALAVRGPAWLVGTSLARTTAGLAPLAAAAIGIRFGERTQ
jgi:hypothetical protein